VASIGDGAPLLPSGWQLGNPQQELPTDDPPGINTFGLEVGVGTNLRRDVPFWAEVPAAGALTPSNVQLPAWDVVFLAGEQLPGLCVVTGRQGKRFDVKKTKGSSFATLTHQGQDPAEVKVVERIWTRQQLHALWRIMPILQLSSTSLADGSIQAMEIRHPAVDLMGISAVVLRTVDLPHASAQKGVFEVTYDLLEYRPMRKNVNVTGTANGAAYDVKMQTDQGSDQIALAPLVPPQPPFTDTGPAGARGR